MFRPSDHPLMLEALNRAVLSALPKTHSQPDLARFYALIRDYPERGGKRLRGLLLLLSTAAHGANWQQGLEVAAALELFQNWVLIHDDIEDDSLERRGSPALHQREGMPVALNVGDALHVYMWQLLHNLKAFSPAQQNTLLNEFAWIIQRTAEGQHLDLSWVKQQRFDVSAEEYIEMVTLKTAHYTVSGPLRLGALCAGLPPDERLISAGTDLGVAFQIRDDVLNLMPEVSYGKEFSGDLYEAKRTLILAHLFAHASASEQLELKTLLAKARHDKTADDINSILRLIKRYGSLDYAQEIAEARASRGLSLLKQILNELPAQAEVVKLTRLLESLAKRRQ